MKVTSLSTPPASGGGYAFSSTPGDSLTFSFSGDDLALVQTLEPAGGQAAIQIDGSSYGILEFYFNEPRWQVPAVFDHLGGGLHTFNLTVSSQASSLSTGSEVIFDALALPSPYRPSAAQQQALKWVNRYRALAGIPLARAVQAINLGAQGHAEFVAANQGDPRLAGLGFHGEQQGMPGFIGAGASDRALYFGYSGGVGEDGHFVGDPINSIDGWMATVYHRNLILSYGCDEMGYGVVNDGRGNFDVLDMGSRTYSPPPGRQIYTYPAAGQTEIPSFWGGGEGPDPLPEVDDPVGYPVSLYLEQGASAQSARVLPATGLAPVLPASDQWQVTQAELRGPAGELIPAYVLEQNTDANDYLGPDTVFLIAEAPLAMQTSYTAHVSGWDSRGVAFDHSWSFTTWPAAALHNIHISPHTDRIFISWWTAGEATTRLAYGSTTAYGTEINGEDAPGTYHTATLPGLALGNSYHFRITAQDANGNIRTSEDYEFTPGGAQPVRLFLPALAR